ncbi:hypothetical protein CASFOL_006680 [Castilleja foliolosa]|uniref:S-protein homolog n=1 Tax=Castilleja foliolosa TaxID=1961234 RepID=A0ABD3E7M3_9LAMI
MKVVIVLYILFFLNIFQTNGSLDKVCFTDKYEVHVINRLPNPQLEIHCASKDDELGHLKVDPCYDFHWTFCDGYHGKTLFFCHLWWKNTDAAFDVFTSEQSDRCFRGKCTWEARPDGIYFAGGQSDFKKFYDWKKVDRLCGDWKIRIALFIFGKPLLCAIAT